MTNKTVRIIHWASTLLFAAPIIWSAIQYFMEAPKMMATFAHLGYPVYFTKFLGVVKVLGVAALLFGRFRTLKEWAYAGFTFELVGAFLSHLSSGDSIGVALVPIAFLVVLAVSYVSWKRLEPPLARRG